SATDYALVSFGAPAQYHYAAVAGNGTWALLNSRSMVHYAGTPNPGQAANVIIAFHREPHFQYISGLNVGDTIAIENRACQTFVYKVTQRWDLAPAKVTQLVPTSRHELTMITCDPWWQDYNRLVWRAELISAPAPSSPGSTGGSVANPAFGVYLQPLLRETLEGTGQSGFGDRLEAPDVHAHEDCSGHDHHDGESS